MVTGFQVRGRSNWIGYWVVGSIYLRLCAKVWRTWRKIQDRMLTRFLGPSKCGFFGFAPNFAPNCPLRGDFPNNINNGAEGRIM